MKKSIKANICASIMLFAAPLGSQASGKQDLTEEVLLNLFRKGSLSSRQEEAQAAQTRLEGSLTEEAFQARAYSRVHLKKSSERPLNQYQPIQSPYEDWSVGVEKALPLGTKVAVEGFGVQYSFRDGSIRDATQVGGRAIVDIDLWKNFLGSLDRARLTSAAARKARSDFQFKVGMKRREVELRKSFWSFVALERSIALSGELVRSAERQLKDAESRRRAGAADRGEVARYQSQVESRKSTLLLFRFDRERVLQALERDLENFRSSDWHLGNYSVAEKEASVLGCIRKISENQMPNLDATNVDEVIAAFIKETESERQIAMRHADIDLSLFSQAQITGNGNEYGNARSQATGNGRGAYAVGLQVSVPLGSTKSESEKNLLTARVNSLEAESMRLSNELRSTHETMLKSIALLNQGLLSQQENSKNLDINYKEMLRKYEQGRISVSTLVLEQDALFQSQLREIDIKRQIAHITLEYFSVFNDFPCEWNRV